MEIRIVIDTPKGWKRRVLMFVVTPFALLAVAVGVALANVPNSFSNGQTLDATQMNQNFSYLDSKSRFVVTKGTVQYSVGGTFFCGVSPNVTTGAAGGYTGTKAACQQSTGCNQSLSAHMCTGEEITRSLTLGLNLPSGWFDVPVGGQLAGGNMLDDCNEWTSQSGSDLGPDLNGGFKAFNCNSSDNILCCD